MRATAGSGLAVATLVAAVGGQVIASFLGTTPLYPLKAAVIVPLLAVLVASDRHARLGPADAVTLTRAVITGWAVGFVGEPLAQGLATELWLLAGIAFGLDAIDGQVARQTRTASPFGARLDMELDGLTVFGLGALLWWLDRGGVWVLAAGMLRYLYIAAGWGLPWLQAPVYPTPRRAWMCGVQLTTAIFALLAWPFAWMSPLLAFVGLVAVGSSFAIDVVWLYRNRA
ncbi:MAG: CDP-alcohol phosphatidyltransferase family protein [Alphaproteobacteria bacterium]|nr:CDP-alcohol phosphatidyltransferase family protein [Alphaproteobacteria bacterium]